MVKRQEDVSWEEMVEVITALCLVSVDDNYKTQRQRKIQIQDAERSKLCVARRIETKTQNTKRQKDNASKKK